MIRVGYRDNICGIEIDLIRLKIRDINDWNGWCNGQCADTDEHWLTRLNFFPIAFCPSNSSFHLKLLPWVHFSSYVFVILHRQCQIIVKKNYFVTLLLSNNSLINHISSFIICYVNYIICESCWPEPWSRLQTDPHVWLQDNWMSLKQQQQKICAEPEMA